MVRPAAARLVALRRPRRRHVAHPRRAARRRRRAHHGRPRRRAGARHRHGRHRQVPARRGVRAALRRRVPRRRVLAAGARPRRRGRAALAGEPSGRARPPAARVRFRPRPGYDRPAARAAGRRADAGARRARAAVSLDRRRLPRRRDARRSRTLARAGPLRQDAADDAQPRIRARSARRSTSACSPRTRASSCSPAIERRTATRSAQPRAASSRISAATRLRSTSRARRCGRRRACARSRSTARRSRIPSADELELSTRYAGELPSGHEASIASTLSRSIAQLDDAGRDFLRLAALLAVQPIPASLVVDVFARADDLDADAAQRRAIDAMHAAGVLSLADAVDGGARQVHTLISRTMRLIEGDGERSRVLGAAAVAALTAELSAAESTRISAPGADAGARPPAREPADRHGASSAAPSRSRCMTGTAVTNCTALPLEQACAGCAGAAGGGRAPGYVDRRWATSLRS